jgi:hypothetical protein
VVSGEGQGLWPHTLYPLTQDFLLPARHGSCTAKKRVGGWLYLASEGSDDDNDARGYVCVSVRVIKIQRTSHGMAWHGMGWHGCLIGE